MKLSGVSNLTPADVYFGRGDIIMLERERIKRETSNNAACFIDKRPPKMTILMGQSLR